VASFGFVCVERGGEEVGDFTSGTEITGQKFNVIYNYRTVLKILIMEFYLLYANSRESFALF
jgi:hypothetical protein